MQNQKTEQKENIDRTSIKQASKVFTSNKILVPLDNPKLLGFIRPIVSSRRPTTAYARVTVKMPVNSVEEQPINLATATPMGTKNTPPMVGGPFLE